MIRLFLAALLFSLWPLTTAVAGEKFQEYFFANATGQGIRDYIRSVIEG